MFMQSAVFTTIHPQVHSPLSRGTIIFNRALPRAAKIYLRCVPWQAKVKRDLGREAIVQSYNRQALVPPKFAMNVAMKRPAQYCMRLLIQIQPTFTESYYLTLKTALWTKSS